MGFERKEEILCGKLAAQQHDVVIDPPAAEPMQHGIAKQIGMEGEAAPADAIPVSQNVIGRPDFIGIPPDDPVRNSDGGIVGEEFDVVAVIHETPHAHELIGAERAAVPEETHRLWTKACAR